MTRAAFVFASSLVSLDIIVTFPSSNSASLIIPLLRFISSLSTAPTNFQMNYSVRASKLELER